MKISKRGEYALRALIDFGIAQEFGRPLLEENPAGGFLAELAQGTARVKAKAPAKRKASR